jgi:hypothetical protein
MFEFKPLLLLCFVTLTLNAAGSRPYMGLSFEGGYGFITQDNSAADVPDIDVNPILYGAKLNVGIDSGEDLRTNIYFGLDYVDEDIYGYTDNTNKELGSSHQLLYSVGFDIVKTYSTKGSSVLPYLRAGMDYGWMPLQGYAQSWANNVGFTVGGGTFLSMGSAELQLGVYYKYRLWGNYNLDTYETQNVDLSDHSVLLELGMNFYY